MQTEVTCLVPITWRMTYEQMMVLRPEIWRDQLFDKGFAAGRADRLAGLPCRSVALGYADGWYSVPNPPKSFES